VNGQTERKRKRTACRRKRTKGQTEQHDWWHLHMTSNSLWYTSLSLSLPTLPLCMDVAGLPDGIFSNIQISQVG
jgi:hypothetical protein